MARITAITPSKRDPRKVVIAVDGRSVATVSTKVSEELGLKVGYEWDAATGEAVARAVRYERAMTDASRRLNRRDMSRATLRGKLLAGEHDPDDVERVLDRLTELGALDDARFGRATIDECQRKRPAGAALLTTKLRQAGLDEALVESLVSEATGDLHDALSDATRLASERLRTLHGQPIATQQRRIASLLARRGFDEETIESALAKLNLDEPSV